MSFGRPRSFANAYRSVGVETGVNSASAHRLIEMLFDGFVESVAQDECLRLINPLREAWASIGPQVEGGQQ